MVSKRRKAAKRKSLTYGYKGMLKKSAGKKRKMPTTFFGLF